MPGGWWCLRWPSRCLEEPEWRMGRGHESGDLDSWGDASCQDTETLLRGRRAACSGESMDGEMGGKLWRARSSGWEWASRGEDGGQGSAGRKDPPRPGLPDSELEPGWTGDVGAALHPGSGIERHGLRGRGSPEASRKTRRRAKLKRDGSLEPFPHPPSSSTCPRTSKQD